MSIYIYIYIYYIHIYAYTHLTRKPNPIVHINTMWIWLGELVIRLSHDGFILHIYVL
jgi:hypothetical protein